MPDVAELKVKISADPSAAHSGIDEAVRKTKEAAGEVESQSGKISSALQNAFSFSAGQLLADGLKEAWSFVQDTVKESINLASDLQEVQNVVDVTFGDAATGIEAWAKAARTEFGLTELQAKQYASTMGAMLKSMGMGEEQVYGMSTAMAELSADMASFYNLDFKTAFDKLRAGIAGEIEPLRQLGINMSVANLEAYALSKGIDKTWESMTQTEQTMLRYNYLMEATADAQGDFARTSDSYANALRTLKTNWDSLLGNIGELFLPVVTDAVVALNSLFETEEKLHKKLTDIDSGFEDSATAISANQRHAEALIDTIAELENKQELTTEETLRYKGAAEALLDIYPELRQYYDESTGQFTAEADAIRDATKALADNALMKAKVAANEKKLSLAAEAVVAAEDAYAEASANAKKAAEDADYAYGLFNEQLTKLDGLSSSLNSVFLSAGYDMPDQISAWANQLLADGANASQVIGKIKNYIGDSNPQFVEHLETEIASLHQYSAAAVQAGEASLTAASLAGEAEAKMSGAKHEYDELAASITGVANASNELGGEDDGGGLAGIKYSADETNLKIKELNTEFDQFAEKGKELADVLDEMQQIRLENFNEAQKNVEGLFGSFDKVKYSRNTSAKNMQKGLESQIEYWQNYKAMLDELSGEGVDNDFLASFADGSTESYEQLEALTKASEEKRAEIVAAWKELQTVEDEATGSLAQTQLEANSEFETAAENAKALWTELQAQITGLQDQIASLNESGTLSDETRASLDEAQAMLDELQEAGETLDSETWEPTADLDDKATSELNAIKEKLDNLDGRHITVYIDYVEGEPEASNAKGLGYVPYDGYISELHRGEQILSAAEVNQREAMAKKQNDEPMTVNITVNTQTNDPYEIAGEIRNALELMRWQG